MSRSNRHRPTIKGMYGAHLRWLKGRSPTTPELRAYLRAEHQNWFDRLA